MILEKPTFTNRESQRVFYAGFGVLLVFIFLSVWLMSQFTQYLEEAQTREAVLQGISRLSVSMERTEAAYRAYLFTRSSFFLERHNESSTESEEELLSLKEMVKENPEFLDLLSQTESILEAGQAIQQGLIHQTLKSLTKSEMIRELRDAHGEVRKILQTFDEKQRAELVFIEKITQRLLGTGFFLLSVAAVLSLGLILLERRRWKKMLSQSSAQNSVLTNVLNNLTDGLAIVDSNGQPQHLNKALSHLMGVTLDGLNLENRAKWAVCVDPKSRQIIEAQDLPLARALKGEVVEDYELLALVQQNQREITMSVSARPICDGQNRIVGAIAFYRDIAKYKALERESEKAQENARILDRRQSEILLKMKTELKDPLSSIEKLSRQLLERSPRVEQKVFLRGISDHARYLSHLLGAALDEVQSEGKELNLKMEPVKVSLVINSVMRMLLPLSQNANVQVTLDSTIPEELEIISDYFRLSEVLFHFLRGRIRLSQNASLSLKARVLERFDEQVRIYFEIGCQTQQAFVVRGREVYDSNSHIEEIISKMKMDVQFEPNSSKDHLVLSMTLDAKEVLRKPLGASVKTNEPVSQTAKSILLVDDGSLSSIAIRTYLKHFGFNCVHASNEKAALENAKRDDLAVLLIDLQSQQFDSFPLIESLQKQFDLRKSEISILGLASDRRPEIEVKARQYGIQSILVKPVDPHDLELALERIFKPLLNDEALLKLSGYKMNGEPLMKILAEDYIQNLSSSVEKISVAIEKGHLKDLQYHSHSLKSLSLTLGLVGVSAICEELERAQSVHESLRTHIHEIERAFEAVKPLLQEKVAFEVKNFKERKINNLAP